MCFFICLWIVFIYLFISQVKTEKSLNRYLRNDVECSEKMRQKFERQIRFVCFFFLFSVDENRWWSHVFYCCCKSVREIVHMYWLVWCSHVGLIPNQFASDEGCDQFSFQTDYTSTSTEWISFKPIINHYVLVSSADLFAYHHHHHHLFFQNIDLCLLISFATIFLCP